MGPEIRPDVCPQPTTGAAAGLMCMNFISPRSESHWNGAYPWLGIAHTLPGLWHCFGVSNHGCIGGDRFAGEFVGTGRELTVLARFATSAIGTWD